MSALEEKIGSKSTNWRSASSKVILIIRNQAVLREQVQHQVQPLNQTLISIRRHRIEQSGGAYTTDDGYVFSPTDVIEDTGDAFVVPHGNHFHYIT